MLALTRKTQESVVVGGSDHFQCILKVKVLEIGAEKVKLGFDVDPDVPVHRLEVWERICRERGESGDGRIESNEQRRGLRWPKMNSADVANPSLDR